MLDDRDSAMRKQSTTHTQAQRTSTEMMGLLADKLGVSAFLDGPPEEGPAAEAAVGAIVQVEATSVDATDCADGRPVLV